MEEKDAFSQSEKKDALSIPDSGGKLQKDINDVFISLKNFIKETFDISAESDQKATIETIKNEISMKGHTAWILVCSIFVASVGLNANSTAVVIGAMLIAPLLSPILGMGLSLAINDIDTMRRSVKNFGIMVFLSVTTAFLFFWIFPLREESSELLARTAPDIRDVLIAFFGGLGLIIARTKKGTIASVIYGVAIATALMPPLCTAGFGLSMFVAESGQDAIKGLTYFGGAMYLFTINSIFICLASFLILKLLRFPMVRYANSTRRRRISQVISMVAFLAMVPALITFYNVFQQKIFINQARKFITEVIKPYQLTEGGILLDNMTEIQYTKYGGLIRLFFVGNDVISDNLAASWEAQANQNYPKLKNTRVLIQGGVRGESDDKFLYVRELYEASKRDLEFKENRILHLEQEISRLGEMSKTFVPFDKIIEDAYILFPELETIGYYNYISANAELKKDTTLVLNVKWKNNITTSLKNNKSETLKKWLSNQINSSPFEFHIQ